MDVTPVEQALMVIATDAPVPAKLLGEVADYYWRVKEERLKADKVSAALKEKETQAHELIVNQLRQQEIAAIGGSTVILEVKEDYKPHVTDWSKFYATILATQDFSLLERRPSVSACKERWELNEAVPGVEKFPVYKLSKRKVG